MKNRFWIYVFVMAMVIVAFMLLRQPKQRTTIPEQAQVKVQPTNIPATTPNTNNQNVSTSRPSAIPLPINPSSTNNDREKLPELFKNYNEQHNVPIEFYGQMIDQDGNPVSDVKIKVAISQTYMESPTNLVFIPKTFHLERKSGVDGRFEITGEKGEGADMESIQKAGYILSSKTPNHFSPGSGSFENPIIIKIWKEGAKESLISGSHVFGIDSGKVYTLDLINGKKNEGEAEGDLRVSIIRPDGVKSRDKYQWSFSMEAIAGGLFESDDEFMYIAPESGYEPKIEMQLNPDNPAWTGVVKKQFYLRSRNGQIYGRVQVEIDAIYNVHSAIQINYSINPAGSRNLQP